MELLLPEFWDPISGPIFPNKGDQERFWRITRRFAEQLAIGTAAGSAKVVSAPTHPPRSPTFITTPNRTTVQV